MNSINENKQSVCKDFVPKFNEEQKKGVHRNVEGF